MIIERNITKYVIFSEDTLQNALRRISENKSGVVFAISDAGVLEGVLTDGDLRRWLVSQDNVDLEQRVSVALNREFVSFSDQTDPERVAEKLSDRVRYIPLLDRQGRITGMACRSSARLRIGDFTVASDAPTFIIAEIGNNHNGSFELACRLVDEAAAAGANCAKFQMRSMSALYRNAGQASNASEDLGAQYTLDLLARFQLEPEQMIRLFDYCQAKGLLPMCTPWDADSLAILEDYGMEAYKLASADLTNHELIELMAKTRKPMICSTGMSTEAEIIDSVRLLKRAGAQFALLHCNSTYPAPFKDVNLNYLDRLQKIADSPIGYSGHERGISVAIAAVAKGARIIEKHFTLDRNMEGNDHRVSLLPEEFRAMVQGIREVEQALGGDDTRRITQGELMNREILGKSLVINCDLKAGEVITAQMIEVRSPGRGLLPYKKRELIGRVARKDFRAGDFFYPSDISDAQVESRPYKFSRPFGIPVRYHDVQQIAAMSNLDLLEFHMSYKDMEEDPAEFMSGTYDMDLVVHAPELFSGDHVMDLCSPDPLYRQRSIEELQKVVDLTRRLKPYFPKTERPPIIINAGGFSLDDFLPESERERLHDLIAESLAHVDQEGVEIIPQSMPPFPWHFGGQRYHNLFMLPSDIERFCKKYGYRICLDVSHSQLACNHFGLSFRDFLEQVGEFSAHLHIVDAEGVDGEGLQIGDGTIDFGMVAEVLNRKAPKASFIPEIWQGHKNDGEGFWVALNRLERWF